jgi:hypothetical protein
VSDSRRCGRRETHSKAYCGASLRCVRALNVSLPVDSSHPAGKNAQPRYSFGECGEWINLGKSTLPADLGRIISDRSSGRAPAGWRRNHPASDRVRVDFAEKCTLPPVFGCSAIHPRKLIPSVPVLIMKVYSDPCFQTPVFTVFNWTPVFIGLVQKNEPDPISGGHCRAQKRHSDPVPADSNLRTV